MIRATNNTKEVKDKGFSEVEVPLVILFGLSFNPKFYVMTEKNAQRILT